ncbi:MAG: class II aldolase/adducin family protein [Beijerinckiaceae bacterium]
MNIKASVGQASNVEQQVALLKRQVSACTLILNAENILGYSGHVSARLPDGKSFLIQPIDTPRSDLKPEDLITCDLDCRVLAGPEGEKPPAETALHAEIFRARPDIMSVAHFHHDMTNSFTLVEGAAMVPVKNHAIRWKDGIPVHPDPAHVASAKQGAAVAATLGDCHAMQIRAHGQIVTGESVPAVLTDSVHFVENGIAQYNAMAIGKLKPLSAEDIESFSREFKRQRHIDKLWRYYVGNMRKAGIVPADWELG